MLGVIVMMFTPLRGSMPGKPMNTTHDRFAHLTITDLQLIARAGGITLPADANRDDILNLLADTVMSGE